MSAAEWRRVVQPILSTVLDNLTLSPSLQTQLMEKELISVVDLQSVMAKSTDYEKKTELLCKYLWTCGPDSLQQFCRALKDAGNRHLAKLLKDRIRELKTEPTSCLVQRQSSRRSYYSNDESEQGGGGLSSASSPRSSVSSEQYWCYVYIYMSPKYLEKWKAKKRRIKSTIATSLEIPLEKIKFLPVPEESKKGKQRRLFVEIIFDDKTEVNLYFLDATPELIKQQERMLIRFLARRYKISHKEIRLKVVRGGSCFLTLLLPGDAVMQLLIDSIEDLDALSFLELGTGPVWVGIGSLPPFSPSMLNVPQSFISRMQLLEAKTSVLSKRFPSMKRRIDSCVSLLKGAEISSGVSASCEKCQTQLTARKNEFALTMDGLSDLNSSFNEIAERLQPLEERRKQFIETKEAMSEINSACLRKLRNVVKTVKSFGQIEQEKETTTGNDGEDDEKCKESDGNWLAGKRLEENLMAELPKMKENIPEIKIADETLIAACKRGDVSLVELPVLIGCDVNARDQDEKTALYYAVNNGHEQIAFRLITEYHANANETYERGETILMTACKRGDESLVRLSVSIGCVVNAKDENEKTALYYAATNGHEHIALYLIRECHANANETYQGGETTLMIACKRGEGSLVRLTVSKGCDVNARDQYEKTALYYAATNGHGKIALYLVRECHADANETYEGGESILMTACKRGDKNLVRLAVSIGCVVNAKDENEKTALYYAATNGHEQIALYLIRKCHANANETYQGGETTLMIACKRGDESLVRLTVSKGCDVNARDQYEKTALYYAANNGHGQIAVYLIRESHADANETYERGEIILMIACIKGDESLVRLTVTKGCNVNARDQNEKTAFYYAVTNGHEHIALYLIRECHANAKYQGGETTLMIACKRGDESLAKLAVSLGCDVNARDQCERTALHFAVTNGHGKIAAYLIRECGANVNYGDKGGKTILMIACKRGDERLVRLAVSVDCDVNARDQDKKTALYYAVNNGHEHIALYLIRECHANANETYQGGETTLMIACKRGDESLAKLAVSLGCDVNARDQCERTALHFAVTNGHGKIAAYLIRECGANVNYGDKGGETILMIACKRGDERLVRLAVSVDCDVNARDQDKKTALYYAVNNGHEHIALYLIRECHANANETYQGGETTLMIACKRGDESLAKLAVSLGCDVNARDQCERTALHFAVTNGHGKIAAYLIRECGANVNYGDKGGETILMIACKRGDESLVRLAVSMGCNVNARDQDEKTALYYAANNGHGQIAVYLIRESHADANETYERGEIILMIACIKGDESLVRLTVTKGCNVNARDQDEKTAFYYAATNGHGQIALYLVRECQVDANETYEGGETTLMIACKRGDESLVRLSVSIGCVVNAKDENEKTALYYAATNGHEHIALYLIRECHANANETYQGGETTLMIACKRGEGSLVRLTVSKGCDVNARDQYEKTALYYAATNGHEHIALYLIRECHADANETYEGGKSILMIACKRGDESLARLAVSMGCDVSAKDEDEKTALYYAATNGHEQIALYLIRECQANENDTYEKGETILMIACKRGEQSLARLAVLKGCDANAIDWDEKTALYYAATNGHGQIALYLIRECGVNVNERYAEGETILMAACKSEHESSVRMFLSMGYDVSSEDELKILKNFLVVPVGHYLLASAQSRRTIAGCLNKDTIDRRTTFAKELHELTASGYTQCRSAEEILARWSESVYSTLPRLAEAAKKADVLYVLAILEDEGVIELSDDERKRAKDALFSLGDAQTKQTAEKESTTVLRPVRTWKCSIL